jgi:uncharacterized protein (DUF1778 family)
MCIDNHELTADTVAMAKSEKTAQLQIRVTRGQKAAVQRAARRAGMDMSSYVLSRALSAAADRFQDCTRSCASASTPSFALAELNTLLSGLNAAELRDAVAVASSATLSAFLANYVAAMVEYVCAQRAIAAPPWTRAVEPLADPSFGSSLQSLRLHLLTHSPPPFRRRNIFIDSSIGQQV